MAEPDPPAERAEVLSWSTERYRHTVGYFILHSYNHDRCGSDLLPVQLDISYFTPTTVERRPQSLQGAAFRAKTVLCWSCTIKTSSSTFEKKTNQPTNSPSVTVCVQFQHSDVEFNPASDLRPHRSSHRTGPLAHR